MFSNLVTLCLYGTNHLPIFVNNLVGTIAVNFLDNIWTTPFRCRLLGQHIEWSSCYECQISYLGQIWMSSLAECFRSLILRLFITCFRLFNSQAIIPRVEITFGEKVMKGDWRVASLLQQFFVMNFFILDAWIPFHLLVRSSWIVLLKSLFCVDHL